MTIDTPDADHDRAAAAEAELIRTRDPERWDVRVGFDPGRWICLPPAWPHDGHDDAPSWVESTGRAVAARTMSPTRAQRKWLKRVLEKLADWRTPNELKYLYLPSLDSDISLLRIQFEPCEGDRDVELSALVTESASPAIEPPVVTEVETEALGAGKHALRYSMVDGVCSVMSVYGFRAPPFDLRITCEMGSVALVPALEPVVRDLVRGISVVPGG
ncbi:hypothetical protein EDF38_1908 [Frigoribacterium sp. PhB160]|uniref:hypothetical protein n=1 Tax=Frigoribacterium sp. PhB160 TaxID=2485192 RepID=UPI000F471D05|nr:hypothetical protein [Frigoribacterium sp. PhB160]ROS59068.1 hypothetical protein EDF38_1908 [Frigoribacterium sp. PhB160]